MVRFICHHVTQLALCFCWRTVQLAFFLTHVANVVSSVCVTFSFELWLLVNFPGHTALFNQKCGGGKVGIKE